MTHRAIKYPQPTCDNCGRFVPFEYGVNDFEWWSGGYCKPGKGCNKRDEIDATARYSEALGDLGEYMQRKVN